MTAIKPMRAAPRGADPRPDASSDVETGPNGAPKALPSFLCGQSDASGHPFTDAAFQAETALARRLDGIPAVDMAKEMAHAVKAGGRKQMALLADIWRMAPGPGRISPPEYMYYRLWDPALDAAAKARFVGKRTQTALHHACNPSAWYMLAHDKLIFQATASGMGLPVPKLLAVYHPTRTAGQVPAIRDRDGLAEFLENGLDGPVFAKPIDGMYSIGGMALDRLPGGDIRANGCDVPVDDLVRYMGFRDDRGYLFQERLAPHDRIREMIGDRLPTMRVLVLVDGLGRGKPVSAVVKLPAGDQIADNYWRGDNLLGALELETGTLKRAINGWGHRLTTVETHPDTGTRLAGTTLPQFEDAMALCQRAAAALPGIRTQSWDIALTDRGPVIMELNFGGDLNLHQLAHGQGVMDDVYRDHVAVCRDKAKRKG